MSQPIADIQGKTILITGGAQGIGGATAQLCAERGARVIITDIKTAGEAHAAAIRANGGEAVFHQIDVRVADQVEALFANVAESHGGLDVLICAAGVLQGQYLQPEEFPLEVFERVMDINVKGTFLCTKYATPLLAQAAKGVMILIASGAGVIGGSSSIAYGTSKGAVNGMGMVLASHLANRGIRVNVVCPGSLNTEMKRGVIAKQAELEQRDAEAMIEAAGLGDPMGVARLLAYLASDDGDYVRRNLFTR
ncbi:MAG TPA: SDR family oxidoreductase [Caldilineaceae bacterium]|nr:SDR family oxidoreductase [Caldilineaceae bacterium]